MTNTRPLLLDLFCGAGGAAMGYSRAGFDVVGVDLAPQPRYPFKFIQGDALNYLADHARSFDAFHASPPCQGHCSLRFMHNAKHHADLIPATRDALNLTNKPYFIENVPGAKMINPVCLCGTMFGLGSDEAELRRHRLFESPFFVLQPCCQHGRERRVIGVYGGHGRDRRREANGQNFSTAARRRAMGIDWMTSQELSQAIPPAYTEFLGHQLQGFVGGNAVCPDLAAAIAKTLPGVTQ